MEQLSEIDYATLQLENARQPQHISMVLIYDQSAVEGGSVADRDILRVFESALYRTTLLRRKLGGGTGGFDTPYWLDDPDFDLGFHVRHVALPRPGDWRQLCVLIAGLHSQAVDMTRPPWEAYVIGGLDTVEGVPPKSFAIILKIHHAAADGMAVMALLNTLHSLSDDAELPPVPEGWHCETYPGQGQIWANALRNAIRRPVKMVKTLRTVMPGIMAIRRSSADGEEQARRFATRFNARISSLRVVDAVVLDLEMVRSIRRVGQGITVNDVILSIVGGALREYLLAKGELPETSICAGQAVSLRQPGEDISRGNKVGLMRVSLATDIEDPRERLLAVQKSAGAAKERASAMGLKDIIALTEGVWPAVLGSGVKLQGLSLSFANQGMAYQVGVTNVPGPRLPLYLAGARLHVLLGLPPLADGMGLGNCVMSYADKITITAVGCGELLPDPEFYRQCLDNAWDALVSSATA